MSLALIPTLDLEIRSEWFHRFGGSVKRLVGVRTCVICKILVALLPPTSLRDVMSYCM
jgi:hypothetical protein